MSEKHKLEDFGEKIGGARKDVFRKRFDLAAFNRLNEIERESLITRNSLWPTPNWQNLHEDYRAPVEMLFWIKTFREAIAQSPEKSAGYSEFWDSREDKMVDAQKAYAKFVCDVRDRCQEALTSGEDLATLARSLGDLYAAIGTEEGGNPRMQRIVRPDYKSFRRIKGLAQENSISRLIEKVLPLSEEESAARPDEARFRAYFRKEIETEIKRLGFPNTADKALEKRTRKLGFWIRKVEGSDKFFVFTDHVSLDPEAAKKEFEGREFDTIDEAQAAVLEFAREALSKQKENAEVDEWRIRPQLESVRRTGLPDHRKGADATPEMFMEVFGFRGGEFGNWLGQEDRRQTFNHAYDALMDLAQAAGIPPRSLSLGGTLAIAFGARGNGGRAVAHYEPARQVMNLTKMHGAGALAHEWAHALDNFLADRLWNDGKHKNEFLTDLLAEDKIYTAHYRFKELSIEEKKHVEVVLNGMAHFFREVRTTPATLEDVQKEPKAGMERMMRQLPGWLGIGSQMFNPEANPFFARISEQVVNRWNELTLKMIDPQSDFNSGSITEIEQIMKNVAKATLPQLKEMAEKDGRLQYRLSYYEDAAKRGLGSQSRNGLVNNREWLVNFHRRYVNAHNQVATSRIRSQFVEDAIAKDKTRSSAYYSQPVELFARSFEFCVQQRIESLSGRRSEYLVNGANRAPIYPGGKDAERIMDSFGQNLVPAVQEMLGQGQTLSETAAAPERTVQSIKLEIRERMKELPPSAWVGDERIRELSAEIKNITEQTQGVAA